PPQLYPLSLHDAPPILLSMHGPEFITIEHFSVKAGAFLFKNDGASRGKFNSQSNKRIQNSKDNNSYGPKYEVQYAFPDQPFIIKSGIINGYGIKIYSIT